MAHRVSTPRVRIAWTGGFSHFSDCGGRIFKKPFYFRVHNRGSSLYIALRGRLTSDQIRDDIAASGKKKIPYQDLARAHGRIPNLADGKCDGPDVKTVIRQLARRVLRA